MLTPSLLLALALAQADASAPLTLEVGEHRVLKIGPVAMQRVARGGVGIFHVQARSPQEIELIALGVGRTTVLIWLVNGKRLSFPLRVVEAAPKPKPTPVPTSVNTARALVDGEPKTVTIVEFDEALTEVLEVRELDGGVLLKGRNARGERIEVIATPRR